MKRFRGKEAAIVLFAVLIGSFFTGCGFHYDFSFSTKTLKKEDAKEFIVEKTKVDKLDKISIDTRIANVELIPSDDYYVEIDYLYWDEEPEYSAENGELSFDDSDAFPDSYSINFNLRNYIRVYLPEAAAFTDVRLDNSSGDITAEGFAADTLSVNVSYGDLTMKNASSGKCDINLSSGKSKISDFYTDDLNFKNSYGDAEFTNINTGTDTSFASGSDNFKVSMSSGDLDLNGLKSDSVDVSNSYGDVNCKDIIAEEFDAHLSSGNLDVKNADLKDVDVNNSYGNVTMALTGTKADYVMDLNTSYGEIRVDGQNHDDEYSFDNGGSRKIKANLSSGDIGIDFAF